jgi:CBS domain-containing protein
MPRDLRKESTMKAKDLMTSQPKTCAPDTNLAAAAELMLAGDCGLLPVVEDGRLVGVVTDRDLYIALATRHRCAADLTVGEVTQRPVYSCAPEDDASVVLETMRTHRVRRVPVEGFGGTVIGIISLDDLALAAGPGGSLADREVVATLRALRSEHHAAPVAAV